MKNIKIESTNERIIPTPKIAAKMRQKGDKVSRRTVGST